MEFESPKQTAERLGVTVRAVQKWAREGRLNGAKKLGREWLVPVGAEPSEKTETESKPCTHQLMPLLTNSFVPGQCEELIESIEDEDDRAIALAEYNYYKGQSEKAIEIAELYLNHSDYALSLSASFIYAFANLSSSKIHLTELGLENIGNRIKRVLRDEEEPTLRASAVFIGTVTSVLLHQDTGALPPIQSVMADLPKGLKLFSVYIMAHKAYLDKEYSRAVGLTEACLAIKDYDYPVPSLYLKLIKCVCLMNLKRSQEAKLAFNDINRLALDEKFYQPFVEHHGLLQGIVEAEIKKSHPSAYKDIVNLTNSFSKGWRTIHNELTESTVTIHLTTTEFAVAMLFNRNWSVKEIAVHMDISPRMVKHHLSVIYEKLDVSNREELGRFLHK